jgi:hypothetical protein
VRIKEEQRISETRIKEEAGIKERAQKESEQRDQACRDLQK